MGIGIAPVDNYGLEITTTNSVDSTNLILAAQTTLTNNINLDILGTGLILKSSNHNTYSYTGGKSHKLSSFSFIKMGPRSIFNVAYNVGGLQNFFSQSFPAYVFDLSISLQGNGLVNGNWIDQYYKIIKSSMINTTISRIFAPWDKLHISGSHTYSNKDGESIIVDAREGEQLSYEAITMSYNKTYRIYWPRKAGNWVDVKVPIDTTAEIDTPIISWDNVVSCNISCQDKIYSCSIQTCS